MNQRNVDALRAVILDADAPLGWPDGTVDSLAMAQYLASRGVLVPSALTEEDCLGLPFGYGYPGQSPDEIPQWVRETLERIAKGEA